MGKLNSTGFNRSSESDQSYRWPRLLLRRLARRRLLSGAVMVCTGLAAAATFGSKDGWDKPSPGDRASRTRSAEAREASALDKKTAARRLRTGATTRGERRSPRGPRILSTKLKRCINCKRLFGYVEERYNGVVPLYCRCGRLAGATYSLGPPLSSRRETRAAMKSLRDDTAMWAPLSDHIGSDGQKWHQPGFAALSLDHTGHGFPLVAD